VNRSRPSTRQGRVRDIEHRLREVGDPARADREKAYLKSELRHFGASFPAIRNIAEGTFADDVDGRSDLVTLVEALWARPVHECRMTAVELLDLGSGLLRAADLTLVERLIRESKTWALVDGLAASVAGALVERYPDLGASLDRWSTDADFWLRRSALLALLVPLRRGDGDFDRFTRYAESMLDDREFFVRKAIGWVLRDTARKRPDLVYAWLERHASRASSVTAREAVKYLTQEQRGAILAARPPGRGR
jgi:3-methyladenine DNA glycosylase AlkD